MGNLRSLKIVIILTALALSLAFMAFGCKKAVETGETGDTIKIGFAAPMSGDAAAYGEIVKNGAMMKIDEINDAGGIDGKMLELVIGDERCDPKEAAAVAQNFVSNEEIVAIVGHVCSSAMLAAIPIYDIAGPAIISPTCTNINIGTASKNRWTFRDVYRDDFQGSFMAKYAKDVLGLKKVAVFYENNDYAIGLKDAFEAAAKEIGLEVVGSEAYTSDSIDFTPQLTKFKELAPDGIFIAGYYEKGGLILSQAMKLGIKTQFMGADGLNNPELVNIAKEAAEGFVASSPFVYEAAGGEALTFKKDFESKYGLTPDWMAANAYDCVGILAEVIAKVGTDRMAIRDGLQAMNSPETGYKGLTGVTYFDANGDCQKPAYVTIVKDGTFIAAEKQMF
jgi:branched-chain amino acid transport system substrate-binding protein